MITQVIDLVNTKVIHISDEICAMETMGQRLKQLREAKGLSQGELAKRVGLKSQGAIGNIERDTRGYGASIVGIARELGTTPEYLKLEKAANVTSVSNTLPGPDIQGKVPLISWVQAGSWCQAEDPFVPGDAERWMDCPVAHSGQTFALRVRGDSMSAPHGNSRTYPEGCFIFVDPEKRSPNNGDRIIACLDESHEVTFKVYKNEDGRQWLQPLNPTHEPIRDAFTVLGTVLGKWEDG